MLISHVDAVGRRSSSQKCIDGSCVNPAAGNLLDPERNSRISLSVMSCLSAWIIMLLINNYMYIQS